VAVPLLESTRYFAQPVAVDIFGNTEPKKMPKHFFWGVLDLDYSTAIRADTGAQDYTVCPRQWYIDAHFRCADCGSTFLWSAVEQKAWFETYRFYVDSQPTRCQQCRAKRRDAVQLRKDYDALVAEARTGGSAEQKRRVVLIIDELEDSCRKIPERMRKTRDDLRKQLSS